MDVIVRWLQKAGKYSCVSSSMVDRCFLLKGGCCRQESTAVSLVVWLTGGCYCKVVAVGRKAQLYLWYNISRHVVIVKWLL